MPWPIPDLRTTLYRAFGHWLIVHGDALYRYALLRLRDEHKAEEAVQETLLAALQARARIAGGASVRTWLIGSLKHKILDQFRREAREIALDDPDGGRKWTTSSNAALRTTDTGRRGSPTGATRPGTDPTGRAILGNSGHCLELMPERHASLFLMRELQEESTETICGHFGITSANLWTMLYRARLSLRKCIESLYQ